MPVAAPHLTGNSELYFNLFRRGEPVEDVMRKTNCVRSTVMKHLAAFIQIEKPTSIATWVPQQTYHHVLGAIRQVGLGLLKPIFLVLGEKVDYDTIRLVVAAYSRAKGGAALGQIPEVSARPRKPLTRHFVCQLPQ